MLFQVRGCSFMSRVVLNCSFKMGYLSRKRCFYYTFWCEATKAVLLVSVRRSISTPHCTMFHVLNIFMMENPGGGGCCLSFFTSLSLSLSQQNKQGDSERRVAWADRERGSQEWVRDAVNYIVNSNPATNASHWARDAVIPDAQLSASVQPAEGGRHVNSSAERQLKVPLSDMLRV